MATVAPMTGEPTSAILRERLQRRATRLWPCVFAYGALLVIAASWRSILPQRQGLCRRRQRRRHAHGWSQVRDFLNGQSWFDLMQYRMESRHADALVAADEPADRHADQALRICPADAARSYAALFVWPLSILVPSLWGMGLAGRRVGGVFGMHIALALTITSCWSPAIASCRAPSIITTSSSPSWRSRQPCFSTKGTGLLGYAITQDFRRRWRCDRGETTPFVAGVCLIVSLAWAWDGKPFASAAKAFGLTLALSISLMFFGLVPPRLYSTVTCDNLSLSCTAWRRSAAAYCCSPPRWRAVWAA